ncbi:hypothetical protein POM88_021778 [Heracleum sosnowskyi]|uniref:Uncharacterized protein n=1 Tax=Heracleum sosnowskyi TaxID=360622 RepID=A0AAD8IGI6_9APIA|nr:hypothetical protein POM88_021778 [Heracleum sosnowskyi]
MGQGSNMSTQMLNFIVIKATSTYDAILGRTGLYAFKVVASSYHLKIKFPTRNGIGEEWGDQKMARSCYVAALRPDGIGGQALPIEDMDTRDSEDRRGKPTEDLIPIPLVPGEPEKVTYVGALLPEPLKNKLISFL